MQSLHACMHLICSCEGHILVHWRASAISYPKFSIYVCVYACVCMCVYYVMYVLTSVVYMHFSFVYSWIYVYTHESMYTHMNLCINAWIYVHTHESMYTRMNVCTWICIFPTHPNTWHWERRHRSRIAERLFRHKYIHTCVCVWQNTHTHTHTHIYTHT